MSDDISMKALGGDFGDRSSKIIEAGCDIVLHCNGDMDEMNAVADVVPELAGISAERCARALAERSAPDPGFDRQAAWAEFQTLTGWQGV